MPLPPFVQEKTVLDIACGTGYGCSYLKRKGARTVIGGDVSNEALAYAKSHYEKENLSFIYADASKLPFSEDCFDVIVSFETIEHLAEPMQFLSECRRVLKKGGLIICSTPNKKVWSPYRRKPLNPFHIQEFDVNIFSGMIKDHFVNQVLYMQGTNWFFSVGSKMLSIIPKGERFKLLAQKLIPSTRNIVDFGTEIQDNLLDKKFEVKPYQDKFSSMAEYIFVVAEKGG